MTTQNTKAFNDAGKVLPITLPAPLDIWKTVCWPDQNGVQHCTRHWVPTH